MTTRILIAGQAKTGTTAVFYKILNSLPPGTTWLFEPQRGGKQSYESEFVLAKILVDPTTDLASFDDFERKVLIVRDPRDRAVSVALYSVLGNDTFSDDHRLAEMAALLREKERDPRSISLTDIILQVAKGNMPFSLERWLASTQAAMAHYTAWLSRQGSAHLVRYEEFVRGDVSGLANYLDREMHGSGEVGEWVSQVVRTKGAGDWRNWFCPADVELFKPIFQPYMDRFGYGDDWELSQTPEINPLHASEYVLRIAGKMRRDLQMAAGG